MSFEVDANVVHPWLQTELRAPGGALTSDSPAEAVQSTLTKVAMVRARCINQRVLGTRNVAPERSHLTHLTHTMTRARSSQN